MIYAMQLSGFRGLIHSPCAMISHSYSSFTERAIDQRERLLTNLSYDMQFFLHKKSHRDRICTHDRYMRNAWMNYYFVPTRQTILPRLRRATSWTS